MSDTYRRNEDGSFEHRKMIEQHLGKKIPAGFEVHHINGRKSDNRLDNLITLPKQFHKSLHVLMRKKGWITDRKEIRRLLTGWKQGNALFLKKRDKRKKRIRRKKRFQKRLVKSQMQIIR